MSIILSCVVCVGVVQSVHARLVAWNPAIGECASALQPEAIIDRTHVGVLHSTYNHGDVNVHVGTLGPVVRGVWCRSLSEIGQ